MAKRISHVMTYDASPGEVARMLADPAFREEVCARQGVLRAEVDVVVSDAATTVKIDQVQAAHGIPGFAQKFVGEEIHIVQLESWTSPAHGDIEVTIPGKPGDMSGTAVLTESGGRTTETVDLTVKVGIPLVGGKLEGLIGDLLLKALRTEETVGHEWLARAR